MTVCLLAQIMGKSIIRSLSVQSVNNTDKDFKISESDTWLRWDNCWCISFKWKAIKPLVKNSDAWWGITFCKPQRWDFSETCWWTRMRGYEESKKNVFTYAWDFEFCNVCRLLCCGCCFCRSCRYCWLRVMRWWYFDDKKCRSIVFRWKIGSTYVPLMTEQKRLTQLEDQSTRRPRQIKWANIT